MTSLFYPPVISLVPASVALLIASLAAYISLGLVRHAHDLPPRDRRRWLVASALGLGTAAWSVALVAQSGVDASGVSGFSLLGLVAAWLLAVAIAAASLALATRRPLGWGRVFAGAALFGLAGLSSPMLSLWSAGLRLGAPLWAASTPMCASR